MADYLLLFRGDGINGTEAQAEATDAWHRWFDDLGGALVDAGNPVVTTHRIGDGAAPSGEGDGERITGYSIISADGMGDAVALAETCPILLAGGSVEVCETIAPM